MALLLERDVNFTKLKSLKKNDLAELCKKFDLPVKKEVAVMIESVLSSIGENRINTKQINEYVKDLYKKLRDDNMSVSGATHEAIVSELNKVDSHIWGMVQGAIDAHIQTNYVRKFFKYNDIVNSMESKLYETMKSYALCTWYNHWSTVFLEDIISLNENVIPIIKKVKGVDIIWNEQPVDIKVTNLPKEWFKDGHTIEDAMNNPILVSKYLYELQGAQRFGDDNRLFIIIYDINNPLESWKIKREYNLIKNSVDDFFSQNIQLDPVTFSYGRKQYQAHSKVLFIVK